MESKVRIDHSTYEYHHCVYTFEDYDSYSFAGVPLIKEYLQLKLLKFKAKNNVDYLIYTIGYDGMGSIVLAVCHPLQEFEPNIGKEIVLGRLKRLKGELINRNGTVRKPYEPIPPYIFKRKEVKP